MPPFVLLKLLLLFSMRHFSHSISEHRLLFRGETPSAAQESSDSLDVFTNELRQLTAELRKTYADTTPGDSRRDDARDVLRDTENKLEGIRGKLFADLRDSGLVPGLKNYISLGGDFPSLSAGFGWQPDSGRLWFDADTYPEYTGGDSEDGHGYSLDDPGTDSMFSALVGTPGNIDLLHLFSGHAAEPLPYGEREEPFYVAPTGLFPSPISMIAPQYGADRSRIRSTTVEGLDALRRAIPRTEGTPETRRRVPYGTPGSDGFPPAPPASELRVNEDEASGTPGSGGFPPAPPEREESVPPPARSETRRTPRTPRTRPAPATPERTPQADQVEKLETEMAETRREYNAARSEASEARRLPPGPDRTARLTRLAERMENMVARIETLEQEIRKLRSSI